MAKYDYLKCPYCDNVVELKDCPDYWSNEAYPDYKKQEKILKNMQKCGFNVVTCAICGGMILVENKKAILKENKTNEDLLLEVQNCKFWEEGHCICEDKYPHCIKNENCYFKRWKKAEKKLEKIQDLLYEPTIAQRIVHIIKEEDNYYKERGNE